MNSGCNRIAHERRSKQRYLPFGAGPRICVGAQFAMAEATLVLAALVQSFRIALVGDQEVMPRPHAAPSRAGFHPVRARGLIRK